MPLCPALVSASSATQLATVHRLDQVYVDITQPVAQISALRRQIADGVVKPDAGTIEIDGAPVALAPKEFDLALLFFRNIGRLMSRDVLAECVWNREIPATSRTLDTHLSNIRQKLQLRPEHGVRLSSSYALGYRLELTSPAEDAPAHPL